MISINIYPNRKETEIEWLGEIPEHWDLCKLKHISTIIMGQSPNSEDCNIDGVGRPFLQGNAEFGEKHPKPKNYCNTSNKLAQIGDYLLSVRAPVGALNISDQIYGIGRGLCAIRVNQKYLHHKYTWYLLNFFRKQLDIVSTGSTYEAVSVDEVKNSICVLPSLTEQCVITDFLDRETARIDALIEKYQRMMALLEEKRTSIISYYITGGQAGNQIQTKSNFTPWLFPLSTEWKRKKLKYISYIKGRIGYENLRSDEYTDEGPLLVSSVHFIGGKIDWEKCNHVTRERFEMSPGIIIQNNDVLFMKDGALMGKIAFVDDLPGDACLNSHLLIIRPLKEAYLPKFLLYTLMSSVFRAYLEQQKRGTTFFGFSEESMGNFPISFPSIFAQKEICDSIDQKTFQLIELEKKIKLIIERMQEYRSALISAAVTGKINVMP